MDIDTMIEEALRGMKTDEKCRCHECEGETVEDWEINGDSEPHWEKYEGKGWHASVAHRWDDDGEKWGERTVFLSIEWEEGVDRCSLLYKIPETKYSVSGLMNVEKCRTIVVEIGARYFRWSTKRGHSVQPDKEGEWGPHLLREVARGLYDEMLNHESGYTHTTVEPGHEVEATFWAPIPTGRVVPWQMESEWMSGDDRRFHFEVLDFELGDFVAENGSTKEWNLRLRVDEIEYADESEEE